MGHIGTSCGYPAGLDELVLGRDKIVPGVAEFEAQALCLARRRRHARALAGELGTGSSSQRASAAVPRVSEPACVFRPGQRSQPAGSGVPASSSVSSSLVNVLCVYECSGHELDLCSLRCHQTTGGEAQAICTSRMNAPRTCATASRTRSTPRFSDRASSQRASHLGSPVERAPGQPLRRRDRRSPGRRSAQLLQGRVDGLQVERLLFAGNSLDKARAEFAAFGRKRRGPA